MAKCSLCNARKGKRKCLATNSFVCSLCCGQFRDLDKCEECSYYKDPNSNKNYQKAPHLALKMMADNTELQDDAQMIESAICQFDFEQNYSLDDNVVLRITELLLDKYHFNEAELSFKNQLEKEGFCYVDQVIKEDIMSEDLVASEDFVKIIATIYRSVKRHSGGRRGYLNFIRKYIGMGIG